MANIQEIRDKYPQYNDMSDMELADAMHSKHYSDMPKDQFYSKIGLSSKDNNSNESHPLMNFLKGIRNYEANLGLGLAQGAGDVAASIGNFPADIYEELGGRHLRHFPHPDLRKHYYEGNAGKISSTLGELLGGAAVPGGGAYKAVKLAGAIKGIPGVIARIGAGTTSGALGGAAASEGNRGEGAAIGGALGGLGSTIPSILKGGKNVYDWHQAPKIREQQYKDELLKSLLNIEKSGENITEQQKTAARLLTEKKQGLFGQESVSKEQIHRLFPNLPDRQVKAMQVNAITQSKKNLKSQFNDRYKDYTHGEIGSRNVVEPYVINELVSQLNVVGKKPISTKKMANELQPREIELGIYNDKGEPYKIRVPAKNSTVNGYIQFMRETRDAASHAYRQAKNATHGEKLDLQHKANALENMSEDASRRAMDSMTSEEAKEFSKLQNDYRHLYVPFNTSNTLRGIVKNRESNTNLHNKMLEPRQSVLHDYLLQNEPAYKESLLASRFSGKGHPLSAMSLDQQASAIKKLGMTEKDISSLLSPEQQSVLQGHIDIAHGHNWIDNLKKAIKENDLSAILNQTERAKAKNYSPKIKSAFDAIDAAKNAKQELIRQAKLLKMKEPELEKMLEERNKYKNLAKMGMAHLGMNHFSTLLGQVFK
jgi:hypothetical protein